MPRPDRLPPFERVVATHGATVLRVDSGLYTASRIHLRGSEPLGPGLEAVFFMEHRFAADTGAQAGAARFWPGP